MKRFLLLSAVVVALAGYFTWDIRRIFNTPLTFKWFAIEQGTNIVIAYCAGLLFAYIDTRSSPMYKHWHQEVCEWKDEIAELRAKKGVKSAVE